MGYNVIKVWTLNLRLTERQKKEKKLCGVRVWRREDEASGGDGGVKQDAKVGGGGGG